MSKKKALYVVEGTGTAQFRYQVLNVIETLKGSQKWQAEYVLEDEAARVDLSEVELLIISRQTAKGSTIPNLIKKAHKKNIKVLFCLDDLIFDYRDAWLVTRGTGGLNIFYWIGYIFKVRKIALRVDGFIATNDFLRRKLERSFRKPCAVIPNSLNMAQLEVADECLRKKVRNRNFTIGYFSGSPTHGKDLLMVENDIIRFLDEYADTRIKFVGMMDFSSMMKKRVLKGQIEIADLVDYKKQMELMSEVDVNIAPLVINDFTNCKSELKFFEAAAVETTTIASPSFAFSKAIENGKNGLLARPGEWYDKLKFLYLHPETNEMLAKNARKYALENYYGKKFLKEVENAYDTLSKMK